MTGEPYLVQEDRDVLKAVLDQLSSEGLSLLQV